MKQTKYGWALGLILAIILVLGNVVFPNNSPDWAPGELLVALVIGAYITWASWHSGGKRVDKVVVGAITSLLGFIIAMITFFLIDNLFLGVVSQQADKINGYATSHASSMQAYINMGLVRGLIFGLPASIVFGATCGWMASHITGLRPPSKQLSTET